MFVALVVLVVLAVTVASFSLALPLPLLLAITSERNRKGSNVPENATTRNPVGNYPKPISMNPQTIQIPPKTDALVLELDPKKVADPSGF